MTPTDRAALTLAVELYRAASRTQRQRIDAQLAKGDDWEDVATYCAFHCQVERLGLPPWLHPPCNVLDIETALTATDERSERTGYRAAAQLLKRMLDAGVSKYEPDPQGALARAEAERRQTVK